MPRLARIAIYPIKSLDPLFPPRARLLPFAGLEYDRRFALRDAQGQFVNGKRTPAIHALESVFTPTTRTLEIGLRGSDAWHTFHVDSEREPLEAWLSRYFGQPIELHEDVAEGFPDDLVASGPTLVSTATLETVAGWFPGLALDDVRLRFRANLEIDGVEPFWEDRLFAGAGDRVNFHIGQTVLGGTNPCQRCIVPSRSPTTGEVLPRFAKVFAERRAETLPAWARRERFDHFYRLSVNTQAVTPGELRVGDELALLPSREA